MGFCGVVFDGPIDPDAIAPRWVLCGYSFPHLRFLSYFRCLSSNLLEFGLPRLIELLVELINSASGVAALVQQPQLVVVFEPIGRSVL
jgi:hypothetical protein